MSLTYDAIASVREKLYSQPKPAVSHVNVKKARCIPTIKSNSNTGAPTSADVVQNHWEKR